MTVKERRALIDKLSEVKGGDGVLVVGTTPFIGEGFDAPALDTLFLAAPISFDGLLVQCAGQIIRSAPDKDLAEVHDHHDAQTPILAASLQRRMPGYRTLGFATGQLRAHLGVRGRRHSRTVRSANSTRTGRRCCWLPGTSPVSGAAGITRRFRRPNASTRTTRTHAREWSGHE